MDGSDKVGRIHGKRNWPAKVGAHQRLVIGLHQRDGKARGEPRDPADRPAVCQALWPSQHVKWQWVVIAEHKIVGRIEPRKSAAQFRIDGVNLLAEAGSQVNGLTESIAEKRLQPATGMPPIDLPGIVRGIADSAEIGVVSEGDSWPAGQRNHAVGTNALV